MSTYKILILWIALLFSACEWKSSRAKNTVIKNTVYVIEAKKDTVRPILLSSPDTSYLDIVFRNNGMVDIQSLDTSIRIHLRYADTTNFLHLNFYDGLKKAYLNCEAAIRLCNAQFYLKQINPNYSLIILDASRPLHIQQMMWDSLKMPNPKKYQYLSPPTEPSLHNYGCAVDVSVLDLSTNQLLDMATDYDSFESLSEPAMEKVFLREGRLSAEAYQNRLLLRKVMQRAKYNPITTEWWHFSICNKAEAAKKYQLIQ